MRKFCKITCVIFLMVALFLGNCLTVFAGTSDSSGSSSSTSGNGEWTGEWGIGNSFTEGIEWKNFSGSKKLECIINDSQDIPSELNIIDSVKGSYILIKSKKTDKESWMRWTWWDKYIIDSPAKIGIDFYSNRKSAWKSGNGQLSDADLIEEANSFIYDSSAHWYKDSTTGKKLDAVWTNWKSKSETESKTTIVYAEDDDDVILENKYSSDSSNIQSLFDSPITELNYSDKTEASETNYKNTIKYEYATVTRIKTYETDGTTERNVSYSYSIGAKTSDSKDITYQVSSPSVSQTIYRPFDLNRNGVASESDIRSSYSFYTNGSPSLSMSVDNKLGKTDGTAIKTVDINSAYNFFVRFNNNQFGIPNSSNGGIDIFDSNPAQSLRNNDGTYPSSVFNTYGVKNSSAKTGTFNFNGTDSDVNGKISNNFAFGGSLKASISSSNASLGYGGSEIKGGNNSFLNIPKGLNQATFNLKMIKKGTYYLTNGTGRNWWEYQYECGSFYTYGVEYSGKITTSGIQAPTIDGSGFYTKLQSTNIIQPILKGTFLAETVAGNIG